MNKISKDNLSPSVGFFGKIRKYGVPALVVGGVILTRSYALDTALEDGIAASNANALLVKGAIGTAAVIAIGYGLGLRGIKIGAKWVWNLFASMVGR